LSVAAYIFTTSAPQWMTHYMFVFTAHGLR